MKLRLFQIDAFTSRLFAGNPAAVCPLERWLDDPIMQSIAAENNLSETAFLVRSGSEYQLRWFTPVVEVDLCGHATLASAFVVFRHLEPERREISFATKSGPLRVMRDRDRLRMDFPARRPELCDEPALLAEGLGSKPLEVLEARDYLAIYRSEDDVRALQPHMQHLLHLERNVIVSAPGSEVDFVSRFFAPRAGVPEDPVTGSAHCTLVPYWAKRLGKTSLHAWQVSRRGGELFCEDRAERVWIAGHAVEYFNGTISL
jgi:predicted PhzF superfamily epimerase YddE/YHI9